MSAKNFATSPLVSAIRSGRLSDVVAAIENGADIEEADMHGFSGLPLRTACFQGDMAIVGELLRRGADSNAMAADGSGAPIRLALRAGHRNIAVLLARHGAEVPPGADLAIDSADVATSVEALSEAPVPLLPDDAEDDSEVEIHFESTVPFPQHLIEEVDVESCRGTDTNLLTMDLLRTDIGEDTPPVTPPPGFWQTSRTRK